METETHYRRRNNDEEGAPTQQPSTVHVLSWRKERHSSSLEDKHVTMDATVGND